MVKTIAEIIEYLSWYSCC